MTRITQINLGAGVVVAALLGWAYWPDLVDLVERWTNNAEYSQGYLVPLFSVFLLWCRRDRVSWATRVGSSWGFAWIAVAVGCHLLGAYYFLGWLSAFSLLPMLVGIAVVLGGREALSWSWPSIAFLVFMLPLPFQVEVALAYPLQRTATLISTFALQTLGIPAVAEGVTILLQAGELRVEEACSGLGMLLVFFALSTAVAIFMPNRPLDRVMVVLSAAPIAIVANAMRITLNGVLADVISLDFANRIFHQWGGWIMMPFALALLGAELVLLQKLFVEPGEASVSFAFAGHGGSIEGEAVG